MQPYRRSPCYFQYLATTNSTYFAVSSVCAVFCGKLRLSAHLTGQCVCGSTYIIKIKIRSSCEIEDFVETHICKLCVILRSRVILGVCVLSKDIRRRLPLELQQCSLYQDQQGDVNQLVRGNNTPRFLGGQNLTPVVCVCGCVHMIGRLRTNTIVENRVVRTCRTYPWKTSLHTKSVDNMNSGLLLCHQANN